MYYTFNTLPTGKKGLHIFFLNYADGTNPSSAVFGDGKRPYVLHLMSL